MIPRMEKEGYPRGYAAALVTCSSLLSLLIPPSGSAILYAFVTGQSVAACFLAIVGPGLLLTLVLSLLHLRMARAMPLAMPPKQTRREMSRSILSTGRSAIAALLLPILVLGGIYGGIVTTTEAAAIAVAGAVVVGTLVYRELSVHKLALAVRQAAITSASMMVMVFFGVMLSRLFIMSQVPQTLAEAMLGLTTNKYLIFLLINLLLGFLGMIMDPGSVMILAAPLLLPVVVQLGMSPIHFGAVMAAALSYGNISPPVAGVLYLGARVGNVGIEQMLKPVYVFMLLGSFPVALAATYWPSLSLFLPRVLGY
jgi:tripartite ATP-independent transporter DctM subunit